MRRLSSLILLVAPALVGASPALAAPPVAVTVSSRCDTQSCSARVSAIPVAPSRLEVNFDHRGGPDRFSARHTIGCAPDRDVQWSYVSPVCVVRGGLPRRAGTYAVAWRWYSGDEPVVFGTRSVTVRSRARRQKQKPARDDRDAGTPELCRQAKPGDKCQPGGGRRVPGGGEKVSHKGWPAITGVFWQVTGNRGRRFVGGPKNDELLGHHGSDRISGTGGKDVIWGDWDPKDNNTWQKDTLSGGAGNDWIYSSHGRNRIIGGPGRDYVWAYYGRGTIDCGPGKRDTARVRLNSAYRVRNCERIKNFCGHGSKPGGGCYKPGEKPASRRR